MGPITRYVGKHKQTRFFHNNVAVVRTVLARRRLASDRCDQSGTGRLVEVVLGVVGDEVLHGAELGRLVDVVGLTATVHRHSVVEHFRIMSSGGEGEGEGERRGSRGEGAEREQRGKGERWRESVGSREDKQSGVNEGGQVRRKGGNMGRKQRV